MQTPATVCYMNDSFPPIIDGVANAVVNYAEYYQKNLGRSLVAVPYHPQGGDECYPFPVIRYRSFNTTRLFRHRAAGVNMGQNGNIRHFNRIFMYIHLIFSAVLGIYRMANAQWYYALLAFASCLFLLLSGLAGRLLGAGGTPRFTL